MSNPLTDVSADIGWMLRSAFIVLNMQTGFCLLQSGAVQKKSALSVVMMVLVNIGLTALAFWGTGYALAFGEDFGTHFAGATSFFSTGRTAYWMFQFAFACTSSVIATGSIAERFKLNSFIVLSFLGTALIYPVCAHWIWHHEGFLARLGAIDFAGGGVVHMVGGLIGLIAAVMVGPRQGRFITRYLTVARRNEKRKARDLPPHNPVSMIVGTVIMWWGWYGFNTGSTLGIVGENRFLIQRIAVNTTLCAAGAGLISYIYSQCMWGYTDVATCTNGFMAGLVASTSGCASVLEWEAFLIGIIGGLSRIPFDWFLVRVGVDDPCGSSALHFFAGIWSMVSVGLFGQLPTDAAYPATYGLFHGWGFYQLGVQLLAVVCICVWVGVTTFLILLALKYTLGLRVHPAADKLGVDVVVYAYSWNGPLSPEDEALLQEARQEPLFKCFGGRTYPPLITANEKSPPPTPQVPIRFMITDSALSMPDSVIDMQYVAGITVQDFSEEAEESANKSA